MTQTSPFQYPLQLDFEPGFNSEDFFVSQCNQDAVNWLRNADRWSRSTLLLIGPQASGKSHLTHIWHQWSGCTLTTLKELAGVNLFEFIKSRKCMALDPVFTDTPLNEAQEELLLHVLNTCQELVCSLLLTAYASPASWSVKLPDLSSRLKALTMTHILPPDDTLIQMLLVKQLEDQQISVPEEVLTFIIPRIERSYTAIRSMVKNLHTLSLSTKRAVTIPLAKQALEWQQTPTSSPIL